MITAATMFAKFKGTGLLQSAVWTPAGGGAGATFEARMMKAGVSDIAFIGGGELALQFMASDAPGIAQGDHVAVLGKTYVLRSRDEASCSADGTLVAYQMREAL